MATKYVSMLNSTTRLDTSGNVYTDNYANQATNDQWDVTILVFDDTSTRDGFYGTFRVPEDFVGTAAFVVEWTSATTSGTADFEVDYRAVGGNDTESLDQSGTQESVGTTDSAPSAAHERLQAEISPTSSNFAAGDIVEFFFARDGADSDTLADAVLVFDLLFKYSDA